MLETEFLNSGVALSDISIWFFFLSILFYGVFLIWGLRLFSWLWSGIISLFKNLDKKNKYKI